jgi:hypothetical protein
MFNLNSASNLAQRLKTADQKKTHLPECIAPYQAHSGLIGSIDQSEYTMAALTVNFA